MAKNKVACGDVLDYTAGGTITSGDPILIGDLLGVAVTSGVSGDVIAVAVEGVFELTKTTHATTAAIAQGAKVYWDAGASKVSNTDNSAANKHIGYAFTAATSTATTAQVRLLG